MLQTDLVSVVIHYKAQEALSRQLFGRHFFDHAGAHPGILSQPSPPLSVTKTNTFDLMDYFSRENT